MTGDLRQDQVLFSVSEGVAWLTLNRPASLNAMTAQMHVELADACRYVEGEAEVRVVVVTGAGDHDFCIGSDFGLLDDVLRSKDTDAFREYLARLNRVLSALENLRTPVIAMVHGRARASGFELLMACDLVLVADDARIGDVHTPYGHMPGAGATTRTIRKIGWQRGLELLWTGRWLSGPEAVEYGIALRSVPPEGLRRATERLARSLADQPGDCVAYLKRAALGGRDLPQQESVGVEVDAYLAMLAETTSPRTVYWSRRRASTPATVASASPNGLRP